MKYKLKRDYVELGAMLQKRRQKLGLTQKQIADALGYSSGQFLSNFERGIARPPLKKLKWLCKRYSLPPQSVARLIGESERKRALEALRGRQ